MMPPFVVFPTNRIAHFVEVSLYLFYLAQQVKLHIRVISLSHFDICYTSYSYYMWYRIWCQLFIYKQVDSIHISNAIAFPQ